MAERAVDVLFRDRAVADPGFSVEEDDELLIPNTTGPDTLAAANRRVLRDEFGEHPDIQVFGDDDYGDAYVRAGSTDEQVLDMLRALQDWAYLDESVESEIRMEREEEAWDNYLCRDFMQTLSNALGVEDLTDYVTCDVAWDLFHTVYDRGRIEFVHEMDGSVYAHGVETETANVVADGGITVEDVALAMFPQREQSKQALLSFLGIPAAKDDQLMLLISTLFDEGYQPRNAVGLPPEAPDYTETEPVPRILAQLEDPQVEAWYLFLAERWIAWSAISDQAAFVAQDEPEAFVDYMETMRPVMEADDPVSAMQMIEQQEYASEVSLQGLRNAAA